MTRPTDCQVKTSVAYNAGNVGSALFFELSAASRRLIGVSGWWTLRFLCPRQRCFVGARWSWFAP